MIKCGSGLFVVNAKEWIKCVEADRKFVSKQKSPVNSVNRPKDERSAANMNVQCAKWTSLNEKMLMKGNRV
jgi:hypothetical protein